MNTLCELTELGPKYVGWTQQINSTKGKCMYVKELDDIFNGYSIGFVTWTLLHMWEDEEWLVNKISDEFELSMGLLSQ